MTRQKQNNLAKKIGVNRFKSGSDDRHCKQRYQPMQAAAQQFLGRGGTVFSGLALNFSTFQAKRLVRFHVQGCK